ncbi:hypothetical protein RJ639_039759 [Escallonia herrerae]|uniref:Cytochrome P450 n=1 Tax=Escallonia herrerae TaxID=1293975 RepID=A0AA89B666_9ASTE|nr:hypothetical protein RJ639_039759 [Escallonia herrerae]
MDMLAILQVTGTLIALTIIYHNFWRLRKNVTNLGTRKTQAPKPRGAWPIVGHLHLLRGQTPVFRTLAAFADKHGPVFTIQLGMRRALILSSKEAVRECFTTHDRAFLTRPKSAALKYMGYNGALFGLAPYGPYWFEMRKISALKLLSNRRLDLLTHVRSSELDRCIKDLYSLCDRKATDGSTKFDMAQWFQQVSMNMMIQMIAGKRYDIYNDAGDDEESGRFGRTIKEFMYLTGVFELSDVIPLTEWMDLQGQLRSMKKNAKELDSLMSSWVKEHIERREIKGQIKEERDFVDVMLSLFETDGKTIHGHKTEDIIKATVLVRISHILLQAHLLSLTSTLCMQNLILAGSDTSSVTMTWALSLLLNHRKALQEAQEEIDFHVGQERWVEESDIKNLVYLQAVVKETMRLYPAGPLSVPREAMEDCYVAGYYVPKGTRLLVNIWKLHRDPNIWTNPCEFQPERFLTSHAHCDVRGQQFEYIPFSSGRRSCPGITASLQMMHLALARLLQGFNPATLMNTQVDMSEGLGLTLPKAAPLEVIITPRLPCKLYQQ